jgi:VWFA-related protein
MRLSGLGISGFLLLAGLLLPVGLRSQNQTPSAPQTLKIETELVHLFVTVRDKHGGLISNLEQNDFQVFEDGQQQKIAYFSKEMDLPLTIGMLIDTSGSQENLLGAEQQAAEQFLSRILGQKDLALVINFDLDVNLLADFTNDRAVLDHAIDRARINDPAVPAVVQGPFPQQMNGTHFYDAVYLACHDKLAEEAGRKAVIALTDAQDYGSSYKLDDAIEAAQRADTVVHVLLIADRWQYFGAYEGEGVARQLAEQTGGRVIRVTSERKLNEAFDELAQELRSQYVIGYYPANSARDGSFRKIKVDVVGGDKDRVLTRDGYYAPQS